LDTRVLTEDGRRRFNWIKWYLNESQKKSKNGKRNKSLTCRYFGIERKTFHKWWNRFNPKDLSTLNSLSRRPKNCRQSHYGKDVIKIIKKIRTDSPTYDAIKVHRILQRDYNLDKVPSVATVGRIIRKYGFFFAVKKSKSKSHKKNRYNRNVKPKDLHKNHKKPLIEFDMKYITLLYTRLYAFVAINVETRAVVVHISTTSSSKSALEGIKKAIKVFGKDILILNDNGSENLGAVYEYLQKHDIEQYFARPHTPKDKPYVERVIRTYQEECLNQNYDYYNLDEWQNITNMWVNDYNHYRPHRGLNNLTPAEYSDKINVTVPWMEEVLPM
jgi:transposase InsO family protein